MIQAVAKELHEFTDDTFLAKYFHYGQDEVGRCRALYQSTDQLEPHHLRNEHGDRLTQHRSLGFNSPNTPAQYTQPVDHCGV